MSDIADLDPSRPDAAAAGFRLEISGPTALAKAWRAPGSDVWHMRTEAGGKILTRSSTPYAHYVEQWIVIHAGGLGGGVLEVLYDGPYDPTATDDDNREEFRVGQPRVLVSHVIRKPDDLSPWAMECRASAARIEALRIECLARSEARQRREAAGSR